MAHYQLILAYDGTGFWGYQRQKNRRTVQGEVESALRRLGWTGRSLLSAGRTDTGVHAAGQVAVFDLNWGHSVETLGKALNALLPEDISVKDVGFAADDFHPRFDARWRTYQYHIYNDPVRDPLLERYAWRIWPACDFDKMQAAATCLLGVHNFSAFGAPPVPGGSTNREVWKAEWRRDEDTAFFEICANAFLYHMVRRVVNLLILIGGGRLTLEEWQTGIEYQGQMPPGLAPARGLVLVEVGYTEISSNRE